MQPILHRLRFQLIAPTFAVVLTSQAAWGGWPHTWGGSSAEYGHSVAVDAAGNVYVAGTTSSFGAGGTDVLILKYSATGTLRWARTWGGSADDFGMRIAVGPDGYIYVTGGTLSFGAGWADLFLLKLNGSGALEWGETWGGGSYDVGYDIGFDQARNIYVVGESYSNGNSAVVLKFSPSGGSPIWSTSWKGPVTYDSGYSLIVDSNFNVIIAGTSWDDSAPNLHNSILLVKYDSSGNYLWSENWITAVPGQDESGPYHSLATDGTGNIYIGAHHAAICATSSFNDCNFKSMVLKLGPAGDFQWAKTWGQPGYGYVGGIGFDPSGHLLIAGAQHDYGTVPELFVSSYDTNGGLLSSKGWGGDQTLVAGDLPGMAVDGIGNAYVTAGAENNGGAWTPIAGTVGSIPNSLVINTFTLGTPIGQVTSLTNQTVSQTGIADAGGGGADVLVLKYPHSLSGDVSRPVSPRQ